jgi:hypothetical protein
MADRALERRGEPTSGPLLRHVFLPGCRSSSADPLDGTVNLIIVVEPMPAGRARRTGDYQKGRRGRRRRLAGAPGRGTLAKNKPPILGLIQRAGQVVLRMLANLQGVGA